MRLRTAFAAILGLHGAVALAQQAPPQPSQSAIASGARSQAYNAGRDITFNNVYLNEPRKSSLEVVGSKVAITSAYLVPSMHFYGQLETVQGRPTAPDFRDGAFLCVEVANISSQPLLVTAVKLDVISPQQVRSKLRHWGSCPGEDVNSVSPECMLQPGQRKKWLLEKGITIPGMTEFLKRQGDEFIFDHFRPRLTSNDFVIERFNQFLRTVGEKTTLKVSIFELNYKPILLGHFQLASGKDLFHSAPTLKKGGRHGDMLVYPLQHDAFLGEALSQLKADKTETPSTSCTTSTETASGTREQ